MGYFPGVGNGEGFAAQAIHIQPSNKTLKPFRHRMGITVKFNINTSMKVNCHQFTKITGLLQMYANDLPIYHIQVFLQTTS